MVLIAFAITSFFTRNHIVAGVQVAILVLLALYSRIASKNRTKKLLDYLESMSGGLDTTVRDNPLPVVIFNVETSEILWSNERFRIITDDREHMFETSVTDAVPDFNADWLLDGKNECPETLMVGDRKFMVYGNMTHTGREYVATTYWVDVSEYERISDEYASSRLIFAIIMLDNYEDLLKGMSEKEKSVILSDIDEKIRVWVGDSGGYLCRFDRDRYFFLFEERNLSAFVEGKFSLLDTVRENIGESGIHATLSIGIGKDGETPQESYRFASLGIEMALSRGGDQAVIRGRYGFEFFGGHSPQSEKRTKVKSRVMASAFGELLSDASTVFVMGHKYADYDSVGAAIGICCIARAKGKTARIVIDMEKNNAQNIIDAVLRMPEYSGVFISEQDAILEADSKSLLVVVDTNRPDIVESETLLLSCTRVAVIDHHRRAATYIDNATLNFHEPYASSTAELVTEMLEYLVDRSDILRVEAEALLAGMVLDTKSFAIHTGSRTFDAAAFLRRAGADTTDIKKLMQSDLETATLRYALMHTARIYRGDIAIASSDTPQTMISIAQAADEILDIEGVSASFAAARVGDEIFISGRSIGSVNVQIVLEKLGGGGNQSIAGVQIRGKSLDQVMTDLTRAIDEYLGEDQQ